MRYLPLIWSGIWRKPARSVLTALSIVVAFALFGLLQGIDATFRHATAGLRLDVLQTIARFGSPMPASYLSTMEALPGVAGVAPIVGFDGFFQDTVNTIHGDATHPARWFAMNPHLKVAKAQVDDLARTRTGAIVGDALMRKYGWKIGDRIPIESKVLRKDGSTTWTFDIVGIYEDTRSPENSIVFIFNYEYLDEARAQGNGTVESFSAQVVDPKGIAQVEDAIDKAFSNAPVETLTFSEIEVLNFVMSQVGNVSFIITAIVGVTFFVLLFLTTSTMIQSVRERIPEFATLKTMGFSDEIVLVLIVAEFLAICLAGALAGLGTAWFVYPKLVSINGAHPPLSPLVLATGAGAAMAVSLISALPGLWTIARMTIVQALAEEA